MDKGAEIQALHAAYCRLTGMRLSLNMDRERMWWDWLRWRVPAFTGEDLTRVIRRLRSDIRYGDRNEGSLKLSNLIGQPDRFEEDLEILLSEERRHQDRNAARDAALRATHRDPEPSDKSSAIDAAEGTRRALDFLIGLRKTI